MKATKTCPKCKGTEIYTNDAILKRGERSTVGVSGWTNISVSVYVCMACGYFEEYIDSENIKKDKLRAAIEREWKRL
ncbi:MAG: hypothetical protein IPH42_02710 [Bacteroidetes bacterium]|jgi:predicted nucleic-acid-binding Zn-ribbon protein|nr:hypothetical protein [Bacteroidota bacterium]MBP8916954.1 hypothetical protein [Chitinophagales bacterium]